MFPHIPPFLLEGSIGRADTEARGEYPNGAAKAFYGTVWSAEPFRAKRFPLYFASFFKRRKNRCKVGGCEGMGFLRNIKVGVTP
jgi:hypothetical protein